MQTRRQLLHRSVLVATVAALSALWPSLTRADEPLRMREVLASGELRPVIGLDTSRIHDVRLESPERVALLESAA